MGSVGGDATDGGQADGWRGRVDNAGCGGHINGGWGYGVWVGGSMGWHRGHICGCLGGKWVTYGYGGGCTYTGEWGWQVRILTTQHHATHIHNDEQYANM